MSQKEEPKDKVFDKPGPVGDFRFGDNVVQVFDDMVTRSVPFYVEFQRMITEMAADFAVENTSVYDLGCPQALPLSTSIRWFRPR